MTRPRNSHHRVFFHKWESAVHSACQPGKRSLSPSCSDTYPCWADLEDVQLSLRCFKRNSLSQRKFTNRCLEQIPPLSLSLISSLEAGSLAGLIFCPKICTGTGSCISLSYSSYIASACEIAHSILPFFDSRVAPRQKKTQYLTRGWRMHCNDSISS